MPNSGGFAVTRTHGADRFYNPPAMRRLQRQLQRSLPRDDDAAENRTDSDESTTLSNSGLDSVCSSSPTELQVQTNCTNLDRLMESVTPLVPVQYFSEVRKKGWRTRDANRQSFFSLGDLWESYKEWSVYGVGVPLLLNGSDSVNQYYVPSLSGIQLYIDPQRLSDAESSRETSGAKVAVDGKWVQHNLNLNSQRMTRLSLRDKPLMSSSSDETDIFNSRGKLVFEYFELEQPHIRQPLFDKVSNLLSQYPELGLYKSCDLSPASWISVAWYPIYRIPVGQTLQNLDASFLTFHCLSSHSTGKLHHHLNGRNVSGVDAPSKTSLPVFGLASYKLRGSIVTTSASDELQQANSLMQAADDWLQSLQVNLPDFQFFASHSPQWR